MSRPLVLAGSLLATLALSVGLAPAAHAGAGNAVSPVADTYVASAHGNTNYGTASRVWVDNDATNGTLLTYLKYDVTQSLANGHHACEGGIFSSSSAFLTLDVDDVSTGGHNVYRTASDSWTETGLTWNNKPAATGSALGSTGATASTEEDSVNDVTIIGIDGTVIDDACANHSGILSVVIADGSDNAVAWKTRETANPPTLTVVVGD